MALYSGIYQTDFFNKNFRFYPLESYFMSSSIKTPSSYDTDLDYLPQVFIDNTTRDKPLCLAAGGIRIRYGIVRISETLSYYAPCPFHGATDNFIEFFRSLSAINSDFVVEIQSEKLPPYLLSVWL